MVEARKRRLLGRDSRCICVVGSHWLIVPHLPNKAVGKVKGERELSCESGRSELPHKTHVVRVKGRDGVELRVVLQLCCLAFDQSLSSFSTIIRLCFFTSVIHSLLLGTPPSISTESRDSSLSNNDDNLERRSAELIPVCHGYPPYYALD